MIQALIYCIEILSWQTRNRSIIALAVILKRQNMHNLKWVFIFFSFGVNTSYSQKAEVEIPGTEIIKFTSAINNQDYVLNIYLPTSYNDTTKKFSVLYVLDGQWS